MLADGDHIILYNSSFDKDDTHTHNLIHYHCCHYYSVRKHNHTIKEELEFIFPSEITAVSYCTNYQVTYLRIILTSPTVRYHITASCTGSGEWEPNLRGSWYTQTVIPFHSILAAHQFSESCSIGWISQFLITGLLFCMTLIE